MDDATKCPVCGNDKSACTCPKTDTPAQGAPAQGTPAQPENPAQSGTPAQ